MLKLYWQFFNFFVRRIVASTFAIGGLVVAFTNFGSVLPGGTINVNGVASDDLVFRLVAFFLPLVVSALGVTIYRAKPFNPNSTPNG